MYPAIIIFALLVFVSITISYAESLFNQERSLILSPLLLVVGKRGFRSENKTMGVNFQLAT
jgi:hypothetical protein